MNNDRRSVDGAMPDGVADRSQGYEHNPNPEDEVAINRMRFEERQRQLQQERAAAAEAISEVQERLGQEYEQQLNDPEHQKFVAEQLEHNLVDQPFSRGGQEEGGGPYLGAVPLNSPEIQRHVPLPTTAREAEEFGKE